MHVNLDEKLYEKLKIEAQKMGISVSELVREKLQMTEEKSMQNMQKIATEMRKFEAILEQKLDKKLEEFGANFERKMMSKLVDFLRENDRIERKIDKIINATKVALFYAVFATLFTTARFKFIRDNIDWEQLRQAKKDWFEKADQTVKEYLGEGVWDRIKNIIYNR